MLSLDVSVIVIFLIVWILVAVLTKVYFNPIRKTVGKRNRKIQQDIDFTQKALESYEKKLQEIGNELRAARAAADKKRKNISRTALEEKERLLAEVSRECREQIQKAKEELDIKVEKLKKELKPESEQLADRIEKRLMH